MPVAVARIDIYLRFACDEDRETVVLRLRALAAAGEVEVREVTGGAELVIEGAQNLSEVTVTFAADSIVRVK